jgi:hypothetical protein
MTPHSVHLSSIHSSYRHLTVQTTDGSPLSVAIHGTLSSDSFYVPDVSLIPDMTNSLCLLGKLLTMTVVSFLTLIFAIFKIVARVI